MGGGRAVKRHGSPPDKTVLSVSRTGDRHENKEKTR